MMPSLKDNLAKIPSKPCVATPPNSSAQNPADQIICALDTASGSFDYIEQSKE